MVLERSASWAVILLPLMVVLIVALYWYWSRYQRMRVREALEQYQEDVSAIDGGGSLGGGYPDVPTPGGGGGGGPPFSPRTVFLGFLSILVLLVAFYILLSHPEASWILKGPEYSESATNVSAAAISGILTFWFTPKV